MADRVALGPPGVGVGTEHIPEKEKEPPSSPKETPAQGLAPSIHHPANPRSGVAILPLLHLLSPPPSSALPVVLHGLTPLSGSAEESSIPLENVCEHLLCAQRGAR